MDRVRKAIRNIGNGRQPETGAPAVPEGKAGGHGDHWGCILRAEHQDELLKFLSDVVQSVEQPEMFRAPGVGMAAHSEGDKVCAIVLLVDERVASAYPEGLDGPAWPITISEIVPWANGIEGQISGDCHGAAISFFDTHFYSNQQKYKVGQTYHFNMSAFAYTLSPSEDLEVGVDDLGAKVSLRGAHAYMPPGADGGADIDDYWFHSPLEGDISEAELCGRRLRIYPVTIALPEEFEMSVNLYAADHVLGPGMEGVKPEDDLEGYLWLQGRLVDEDQIVMRNS